MVAFFNSSICSHIFSAAVSSLILDVKISGSVVISPSWLGEQFLSFPTIQLSNFKMFLDFSFHFNHQHPDTMTLL